MIRRRASIAFIALSLSLGIAACRTPTPADFGLGTTGTRLPIDDVRAEHVLRDYLALAEGRSALRGFARVLLEGPDFKLNRPQRILIERPARLRFEVLGLFDQLAAMLATNGRDFGFYDVSTAQIARGPVTPTLLWDLAKIDLGVHEVVGLLLAAPIPSDGVARSAVWLESDGRIALVFAWPEIEAAEACRSAPHRALLAAECFVALDAIDEGGEVYLFDAAGRLAEVRDLDPGGSLRYRATFEDYRTIDSDGGPIEFPNRVTLHSPRASSSARFTWNRVALAETLADRLFVIPERRTAGGEG